MLKVFHDKGDGVTEISTVHFNRHIRGVRPIEVNIHRSGEFTFELYAIDSSGEPIVILESGFNCGYGGEGPHGSQWALLQLGVREDFAKLVFKTRNITISFRGDEPKEVVE